MGAAAPAGEADLLGPEAEPRACPRSGTSSAPRRPRRRASPRSRACRGRRRRDASRSETSSTSSEMPLTGECWSPRRYSRPRGEERGSAGRGGIRAGGARAARRHGVGRARRAARNSSGRWMIDAQGRVVVLHGVNMVTKRAPNLPSDVGFGADDAAYLSSEGFNTRPARVRLRGDRAGAGRLRRGLHVRLRGRGAGRRRQRAPRARGRPPGPVHGPLRRATACPTGWRSTTARTTNDGRVSARLLREPGPEPLLRQLLGEHQRPPTATRSRTTTWRG